MNNTHFNVRVVHWVDLGHREVNFELAQTTLTWEGLRLSLNHRRTTLMDAGCLAST